MAIAGRVAIVPKGDWSADVTYKRLDAVTYNNTLYFAKKEVPAGTATSNTEYWSKSIVGGVGAIATTDDAGIVKPDGKSMSVDESGTLSINLDGTTITLDEAKNVIKLADALKDKIGTALQPESIVNNQTTTVQGFALDARQANPNLDGTLAKQISQLNTDNLKYNCGIIYDESLNSGDYVARSTVFVYLDEQATTEKLFPVQMAGILEVTPTYADGRFIFVKQTYTTRDNSASYIRMYDYNTGQWSDWKQLY